MTFAVGFDVFAKDRASDVFDKVGNKVEESGRKARLAGAAMKAGLAIGGAAIAGFGFLLKTGFDETKDFSAGQAQLAAGIKSTGNAAHVTVGGMEALASSIQNMSGQTDDSIVAAEQLLLTFTNIKNTKTDKIFDQATQAAADMAAKMGGDAASKAVLLGKALNDPLKGLTALTRVGVAFTDAQKKQITQMVKTGDTVGAQKVILKELTTEFGGAAKAAGESLPGQLERLKRSFEDIAQGLAGALLPILTKVISFIRANVGPALGALGGFFSRIIDGIRNIASTAGPLKTFLGYMRDIPLSVRAFFLALRDGDVTSNGLVGKFEMVGDFLHRKLPPALDVAKKAFVALMGALNAILPVGLMVLRWAKSLLLTFISLGGYMLRALIPAFMNLASWIKQHATLIQALVVGIGAMFVALKLWAAYQMAVVTVTYTWAYAQLVLNAALSANPIGMVVLAVIGLAAALIYAYKNSETFRRIVNGAFESVRNVVMTTFNAIKGVVMGVFNWISRYWPLLVVVLTGPVGAAALLIAKHFHGIVAAFAYVGTRIQATAAAVWAPIGTTLRWMFDHVVAPILGSVVKNFQAIFAAAIYLGVRLRNAAAAIWEPIGAALQWIYDHTIKPILDSIGGAVEKIGSILGGIGGVAGSVSDFLNPFHQAAGGHVTAGVPYIVGEERPELFIPQTNGTIVPRVPTGNSGGISITINAGIGTDGHALGREVIRAVELVTGKPFPRSA